MKQPELTPALNRVRKGNLCAGCGGCAAVSGGAIEMQMEAPGFLRPRQNAPVSAETDTMIAEICPGLGQRVAPDGRALDPLWGPYVSMELGHSTDATLRFNASSGGGLSAVLVHLFESGQVDGVVQIAADPDNPVGNVTVISRDVETIRASVGSRYAPSSPLAGIEPLLAGTERFAFVGKPCDVAALRAWSRIDPRIDRVFVAMVSFFCAGVPSQTGAQAVLAALGTHLAQVKAFRFRGMGWPGRATVTNRDGSTADMSYHDSWGKILSKHVQHRCKVCADGTGKAADIVCADAWHSDEKGYPIFEEQDGISLIVARTAKGRDLLDGAVLGGAVETSPFDVSTLSQIQPGQFFRRRVVLARLSALRLMGKPVPRYQGLTLAAAARFAKPKELSVNFLGMIRRVVQKKV